MSADKYTPDQWLLIRLQRCSTDYSQSMHVRAQAESDAAERIRQLLTINADLLAALQGICDEQDERQGYASHEAYDKARAAIAKATGGAQ